jgi:hypothetical protein
MRAGTGVQVTSRQISTKLAFYMSKRLFCLIKKVEEAGNRRKANIISRLFRKIQTSAFWRIAMKKSNNPFLPILPNRSNHISTALIFFLFYGLILNPSISARTIKVYPIGDSITETNESEYCWRYWLYSALIENNISNIDLVGSLTGPGEGYDSDHDGHSGWRAVDILNGVHDKDSVMGNLHDWAPIYKPDIAIIHLGTNDMGTYLTPEQTVNTLGDIINVLRETSPDIKIVLCQIPYCGGEYGISEIQDSFTVFNTMLTSLKSMATDQSSIDIVDLNTGWDFNNMTIDEIHPNMEGAQIIASRILETIKPMVDSNHTSIVTKKSVKADLFQSIRITKTNSRNIVFTAEKIKSCRIEVYRPDGKLTGTAYLHGTIKASIGPVPAGVSLIKLYRDGIYTAVTETVF